MDVMFPDQDAGLNDKQDLLSIMKLSEKSFSEWDNEEDSIYDSME